MAHRVIVDGTGLLGLGILVAMLLLGVGLGSYAFGWWWRGRYEERKQHEETDRVFRHQTRSMTPTEQDAFERAFDHFDKGFYTMRKAFRD